MSPLPAPGEEGPDFQFGSLTSSDRVDIVNLTTDFTAPGWAYAGYNRFQVTALGADLDIEADWSGGTSNLEKWRHITSTGRDQFVRVVHRGYLYPLGLRAVLIDVTERFLLQDPANPTGFSDAVLQQYQIIKVQQYTKSYPAPGQPYSADWPFTQVTMKTIVTPPIIPQNVAGLPVQGGESQLMQIFLYSSPEFQWTYVLTDENGTEAHVTGPLCFMNAGTGSGANNWPSEYTDSTMAPIRDAYNDTVAVASRQGTLNGEHLKYAPEGSGKVGSSTHPTYRITLEAATVDFDPASGLPAAASQPSSGPQSAASLQQALQPAFYPVLAQALVKLPAADGLSRGSFVDQASVGAPVPGISLQYYAPYVQNGYTGNPGSVYMALTDYVNGGAAGGPALKFPGDAVGGIGTPNIKAAGLSTTAGLVSGDLDTYAQNGAQDPTSYFPASLVGPDSPQLFGGLKLSDLISGGLAQPPLMQLPDIVNSLDPNTLERTITYDLEVPLLPWPPPASDGTGAVFLPQGYDANNTDVTATLNLHALVQISPQGASNFTVTGTITPFTVNILGSSGGLNFLQIPFNRAEFTSQSGKKPDIKVLIGQVTFEGALSFVNALEQFIEDLGGSGFKINVTPTGITGGFNISLPDISIGMVDISGLAMSAAVDVPFLGQPATATFSFASKEKPFTVAVSMFGGSGYITLVLGLHEVQQVTAGINFGGNFELDLGVASGGIQLVAGIFYNYSDAQGVQLTGYVKLSGGVTVLGFLSVGVTLDLSLTYQATPAGSSYVSGSATLTLSVGIFCFHVSFGFTITKQFSGSGSPPPAASPSIRRSRDPNLVGPEPLGPPATVVPATFSDLMTPADWQQYCAVFSA